MKTMCHLKVRISGLLAGIVLLTMPAFLSAADNAPEAPVAVGQSAVLYSQGMPWDQFLAGTRVQRETWQKNAARAVPPGLIDRFRRAGNDLRLLVITAEWCPDSVHSVPYIATLAASAGVALLIVDFRAGKAIMDQHQTPDGRASTPTVILLRGDREVAAWVERPASLQWWYLDMADEIGEAELLERKMSWYDWNRGTDALTEIVVLAEQTAK